MDAEAFLKRATAQRALRRAGRIAQTAIAIHARADNGDELRRVTGCGSCAEACRYVHSLPWGPQACRKSRETPAGQALQRGKPVPFICHMGFACVAAPVIPGKNDSLAMTLGPFCPAESPDALEADALNGLARLEQSKHSALPFTLHDVPRVPADMPAEVAQWLGETLLEQWSSVATRSLVDALDKSPAEVLPDPRRRRPDKPVRDAFGGRAILAAMSGRSAAPLRRAVLQRLESGKAPSSANALRARAMAVAGAAIEAAEQAGGVPPEARRRLAALPGALDHVESPESACRAILKTLSPVRRALLRRAESDRDLFGKLDQFVSGRLADGVTLSDAAAHLELTPSTLTRRVERRFGVKFTGYVARKRVERARSLLERTHLSVDDIARRVGFTDGAHLRKQLQRFEGVSPSDIRGRKRAVG